MWKNIYGIFFVWQLKTKLKYMYFCCVIMHENIASISSMIVSICGIIAFFGRFNWTFISFLKVFIQTISEGNQTLILNDMYHFFSVLCSGTLPQKKKAVKNKSKITLYGIFKNSIFSIPIYVWFLSEKPWMLITFCFNNMC